MAPQREWFEKDYYQVLGVAESATAKEITTAYRKLSRQYHPDANPGDAPAEERFKEVSAAYDVVGNAEQRKEYDEVRRLGPAAAGFPGGAGGGGFSFDSDVGDLGDLLGGLFGRAVGRRWPGARRPGAARTGATTSRPSSTSPSTTPSAGITTTVHLTSDAPVPHLPRLRGRARHDAAALQHLRRPGRGLRQPGPVLLLAAVPGLRRPGGHHRRPVPHLPRHRRRAPAPRGEGPHPRRRRRRPAHPAQGPRRSRAERRPARRPLRGRARRAARRCSGAGATTSPSPCPSPSPRPRSAPTSRCPPSTAPGDAPDPGRHPLGPHVPGEGQGRGHLEGHRGSARHRRGGGTVQAVERRAQGARGLPSRVDRGRIAPRAPRGVSDHGPPTRPDPRRLRHLGGRRAGRAPPADPAHLRAQGPGRPRPHRRRQPPLQRRRHRAAPPHPGAHQRGPQPRRRAEGARARGGAGRSPAAAGGGARGAEAAVERTHRQYRRDLVPLHQSVVLFRDR